MSVSQNFSFVRVFRVFRAIKPIRLFSRSQNLNIMVKSLFGSLPALGNVLLVSGLFIFIFSLLGVNLFKTDLQYYCTDDISKNKTECLDKGELWYKNSNNFDNFYVSLKTNFEIMLADGWGIMMGKAGLKYGARWVYWYYFVYIIVGNLFILNLLISVVIQKFKILKEKERITKRLTEPEKEWINLQKMMIKYRPRIIMKIDEEKSSAFKKKIFNIVKAKWFDNAVFILICLSLITLVIQHHNASDSYNLALDYINFFFTLLFNIEIIMKIYVCHTAFFYLSWNQFDFVIIFLCDVMVILGILEQVGKIHIQSLSALPIVLRSFRMLRILRVFSSFAKLRGLIDSLSYVIPTVLNIGVLMFMLILIYANVGMNIFGQVPYRDLINQNMNFRDFTKSVVVLFEVSTMENWNDIMYELAYHDCRDPLSEAYQSDSYCFNFNITCYDDDEVSYSTMKMEEKFSCGNNWSYIYFISFVIIGPLFIMNLCIVMVIEGFSESMRENEGLITIDYMEKFIQVWLQYDNKSKRVVKPYEFVLILKELQPPIGLNYDRYVNRPGVNRESKYKKLQAYRKMIDLLNKEDDDNKKRRFCTITKAAIEFKDYYISRDKRFHTDDTEVMILMNKLGLTPTEIKKDISFWNKLKKKVKNMATQQQDVDIEKYKDKFTEEEIEKYQQIMMEENEKREFEELGNNENKNLHNCIDTFLSKKKDYYIHFVDACIALSRFAVSKMRNVSYDKLRLNVINSYTKKLWIQKYKKDIGKYSNLYLENKKIKEGQKISVYMATRQLYQNLLLARLNAARKVILEKMRKKEEEIEKENQKKLLEEIGSVIHEDNLEIDIPSEKGGQFPSLDGDYNHFDQFKPVILRKKGSGEVGNMSYFMNKKHYFGTVKKYERKLPQSEHKSFYSSETLMNIK